MELDTFVAVHAGEWQRLDLLTRRAGRPSRLTGDEVDELVVLYQRAATHLSQLRSASPDPELLGKLSSLVARARGAVAGSRPAGWAGVSRFFTVGFPAALWQTRWWTAGVAAVGLLIAVALGAWVVADPGVRGALLPPAEVSQLVNHDFAAYYSDHSAQSFALHVWTNNALIAAASLAMGVTVLPIGFLLFENSANVGIAGGYMWAAGRGTEFFGLILPHGILELTAVFIALGAGLRLGWTWIDPGPLRRAEALAIAGRTTLLLAGGLTLVLAVSGVLEAFVTPSPLPTGARIGIGVLPELALFGYAATLGRRAVRAGDLGDTVEFATDTLPVA